MWVLQLNPMSGYAEDVEPVACADTKEKLVALLEQEFVGNYVDGNWHKCFRQGGPLEWFNPPSPNLEAWIDVSAIVDVGTEAD